MSHPMRRAKVVDVGVFGLVDGTDEPNAAGDYVRVVVYDDNGVPRAFRISRGAAEVLAAELRGLLAEGGG